MEELLLNEGPLLFALGWTQGSQALRRRKPRSQKRDLGHPLKVWRPQLISERRSRATMVPLKLLLRL
jgi:hypothetical protein